MYYACNVFCVCRVGSVYDVCIFINVQGVHNSPPVEKCQYYRRGQVNFKNVILTEHGKHIFDFCNPSRARMTFLAGHAWFRPVLAGWSRLWLARFPFCDFPAAVAPSVLAPGARIT